MKIGIIGLPNVGKSTLFKALTKKQVNCANYPFCTISPNVGVIAVPDLRLQKLGRILKSPKIIPTTIEFVDIAGLVRGAHKGEGLGNQFLSHIRGVDAIVHVVRIFGDKNVVHISGKINPKEDIETVNLELIYADLQQIKKRLESARSQAKSGDKKKISFFNLLEKIKNNLEKNIPMREINFTDEEKPLLKELQLLTIKPTLYVLNISEQQKENLPDINPAIVICAKIEGELAGLKDEEAKVLMKEFGMKESGLDKLIKASYKLLNLITFFTFNETEVRAWTVKTSTKAPAAAGKIHSDFEKNFICAEVTKYENFIKYGERRAKEKGLLQIEGKNYVIQDGDVVHFKIGA